MNDGEIKHKVNVAMFELMKSTGVIAPVDVLIGIGVLSKEDYERWRNGQVDYLERVCKANLRKLSTVMREMRAFAKKNELKASWTYYHGWGKSKDKKLRFSKSGEDNIERGYATHFISQQTLDEKRAGKAQQSDV